MVNPGGCTGSVSPEETHSIDFRFKKFIQFAQFSEKTADMAIVY